MPSKGKQLLVGQQVPIAAEERDVAAGLHLGRDGTAGGRPIDAASAATFSTEVPSTSAISAARPHSSSARRKRGGDWESGVAAGAGACPPAARPRRRERTRPRPGSSYSSQNSSVTWCCSLSSRRTRGKSRRNVSYFTSASCFAFSVSANSFLPGWEMTVGKKLDKAENRSENQTRLHYSLGFVGSAQEEQTCGSE